MMKKKFSLWLNIVTICLCVCAIAIGVYAATSATLTVSGQIGFEAHGVDVSVTGYIYGHAAGTTLDEMKNGLPVAYDENNKVWLEYIEEETTVSTGTTALKVTDSTKTLNLGDRYFSDMSSSDGKPHDITVVLNFTNASKFNVLASVTSTTAANTNIHIATTQSVVMDKDSGTTTTGSITFTLSLKPNAEGEYVGADLQAVSFGIKFEKTELTSAQTKQDLTYSIKKFTSAEQSAIRTTLGDVQVWQTYSYTDTILPYAERFPYYVEMGVDPTTNTALRWLVVGIDDGNGNITILTQADRDALEQGLMLDKDYYLLSEKVLDNNVFLSSSAQDSSYKNKEYGTWENDYTTSEVREYVNDTVEDKYNLTSSTLYSQIQKRTLGELYVDIVAETASGTNKVTGVPTTVSGYTAITDTASTEETLWLLSQTEMRKIFADDYIEGSEENYSYPLFMSSRTTTCGASSVCNWWLRSPGADDGFSASLVFSEGIVFYINAISAYGVRPAFKI